ncbi:GNAT family N-acetyltransferase [Geomicrobium sediminis]|uniref:GNAT superfamily acetyltransferase n=1 Tax=Geomicrobium sediminis TaxID=1347788 RepID=A0ABS2PCM5_9BACL|nr:GNAT family N-acetyltransferase [Geomicrobium sediminis]MBM7633184.1 putative GNAT superfamily acetyltransferase [Geomicrobium sediminis]
MITIRELTTMEELEEMMDVEEAVWQMEPLQVHQTFTVLKNGGIILGAYDDEKMIGFLYSFPGFVEGDVYLCSHMLGFLPDYRKRGIGVLMKQRQAELAKERDYQKITWTFDPLETPNAYLNIQKLRAIGAHYKVNHYGEMADEFNTGLPTDRMIIEWDLTKSTAVEEVVISDTHLLLRNNNGHPKEHNSFDRESNEPYYIAVPSNFQQIKEENFELAKAWRFETQQRFVELFQAGYVATGVKNDLNNETTYYKLTK